uniref:At3g05675-like ankyrin-like domain-containing protein n=1 Tax=Davidia involucrata TaxID=16924 RepID=A0A5B7BC38_DAVIN
MLMMNPLDFCLFRWLTFFFYCFLLQVRMKLVKDWLPVLIVCKDNVSPMLPSHKSLYLELEETFLKIISTLPMSDAQELLQQCLSFSTRNVEECPHLVNAFNTWFRRATRSPQADNLR